jgi:hypothetical protein
MGDFNMTSSEPLMGRISDELSSYSANGVLDIGKLWVQLKWFSNLLNLAVYEQKETIINLKDYRAELPCDFFLLDSAWLCGGANVQNQLNFQAELVVYTETTNETVGNDVNCALPNSPNSGYLNISACNMDTPVYDKVTTKEYIYSGANPITWQNPVLLSYKKGKSMRQYCAKDCANLFSRFPQEISINKEGDSYYLYSPMKEAVIYVKYYNMPMDPETKTPLIPDDAILQECLFKHLVYTFIRQIWTNGDDANLENKLKFWKEESELAIAFAMNYAKMPTFNKMVQLGKRSRKKFASYEVMNSKHY